MSWDICIQDLPDGIVSVDDIPDDFVPRELGPREAIISAVQAAAPIVLNAQGRGCIELQGGSIEVNVGEEDPCARVSLLVRGDDSVLEHIVAIVDVLGGKALDPGSDSGMFDREKALQSLHAWRTYRDQAVQATAPKASKKSWWKVWG